VREIYRAYVDASFSSKEKSGIGYAIFKDDVPIYVYSKQENCTTDSNTLEYIATLELLRYINKINLKNVDIYTDSRNLTVELQKIGSGKKIRNSVIRDILYELSINPSIRIKWIERKENKFAHDLSQKARYKTKVVEESHLLKNEILKKNICQTRIAIRYKPKLFRICSTCNEKKSVTEFPKRRTQCKSCIMKIAMIDNSYLKTKNTY
jgi:ribonuclease HI